MPGRKTRLSALLLMPLIVLVGLAAGPLLHPARLATPRPDQTRHAAGQVHPSATVCGGSHNVASAVYATVCGGSDNTAGAEHAVVSGGSHNTASATRSTIGGGYANRASQLDTTIGGGAGHLASGHHATIAGGSQNTASGFDANIGGGSHNVVSGTHATVAGGTRNTASGFDATVGGGAGNTAGEKRATVGGGLANRAVGMYGTVGGGYGNTAGGAFSSVPGGFGNQAAGGYSLAAGHRAAVDAGHPGVFLFADAGDFDFHSAAANEFAARSTGGVRFVTAVDSAGQPVAGVKLAAGSGAWSSLSRRDAKANLSPVDASAVLRLTAELPISTWSYTGQAPAVRHIGPTAEDFHALFGLGEDSAYISTVDADGVALAAIQGLYRLVQQQQAGLAAQQQRIAALEARLTAPAADAGSCAP